MRIIPSCEACLYDKQAKLANHISDEAKRLQFLAEIQSILDNRDEDDPSPYIVHLFHQVQKRYGISSTAFPKEKYNRLILSLEEQLEQTILDSSDPLATSISLARVGNYIDFGAMNQVDDDILLTLIEEAKRTPLAPDTYEQFLMACKAGKTFLLLCDNCGEIVLDKLFIRQLKKRFPHLQITVMVRGEAVLNDATMEDAVFCGITKEATVVTNGSAIAGTVYNRLSDEARAAFDHADVILSKGQGNYEGLMGIDRSIFYSFLCKCDLFTSRFQVPKLTGMFVYE